MLINKIKKSPVAVILVIIGLAAAGWWWFGKGPGAAGHGFGGMSIPVEAVELKPEMLTETIEAVGTLVADEAVVIRPEVSGRITSIAFEEGAHLTKGQLLVQLDDSVYRAEYAQARASLELNRKNQNRASTLTKTGATSERVLDESNASLRLAEANVDLAKARLDKTTMQAPFDGVVGLRKVSVGDFVKEGQEIVNFQRIDPMKVDFAIPETKAAMLKEGQEIEVVVDAVPDRKFIGQVYALDPQVDVGGRSIFLRAKIANADGVLKSGYFARVGLVISKIEDALMVPEEAIMPTAKGKFVFVVEAEKAKMTEVKLGIRRDGKVQIKEGLQAGQIVVTAGHVKIRDGAGVKAIMADAPPPPAATEAPAK